jgi:transposase
MRDEQFDRSLLEHPKLNHSDRKALGLIVEVLRSGCPCQDAPEEEYGVGWRVCWERYKCCNAEVGCLGSTSSHVAGCGGW